MRRGGARSGAWSSNREGRYTAPSARSGDHVVIVAARTAGDIAADGPRSKPLPQLRRAAIAGIAPSGPKPARNAPSMSSALVSSRWASGACISGAPAANGRARHGARMSARISASSTRLAPPLNSRRRRRARTSGLGGDENLHLGIGADHGADVAAVEHGAGRRRGKLLLEVEQRGAHPRDGRNHRRGLADLVALQRGLVEARRIDRLARRPWRANSSPGACPASSTAFATARYNSPVSRWRKL